MSWRKEAPLATIFRRPHPAPTSFTNNTTFHRDSCSEIALRVKLCCVLFLEKSLSPLYQGRQKQLKMWKQRELLSHNPEKIGAQLFDSQALRFIKYQWKIPIETFLPRRAVEIAQMRKKWWNWILRVKVSRCGIDLRSHPPIFPIKCYSSGKLPRPGACNFFGLPEQHFCTLLSLVLQIYAALPANGAAA